MKAEHFTLSSVEQKILANKENESLEVLNAQSKRTQKLVDAFIQKKVTVELEDGTSVTATIEELIVEKALFTEINKSRGFASILDLQKIRGEQEDKSNVNITTSLVDQDLASRAVK